MKNGKLIWLMLLVLYLVNPFDFGTVLNSMIGWPNHIALFILLVIVTFFLVKGNTLGQKWRNIKAAARRLR